MQKLGVKIIENHADYRLLSSKAANTLANFKETNLFLRGLIPLIGFKSDVVYFEVKERFAGKTKYSLKKMLDLALDGIASLSFVPLRLIFFVGFVSFIFSLSLIFYALYIVLFTDKAVPGWASTIIPIYLLGGIQLLSLGIIGEYLSRIYLETKRRPRYIIEEQIIK
jgi:glycosyltransferase involved in cell wall biosynthesis